MRRIFSIELPPEDYWFSCILPQVSDWRNAVLPWETLLVLKISAGIFSESMA
jgi:hypothetical protein